MHNNSFNTIRLLLASIVYLEHLATLSHVNEFSLFQQYLNTDFAVKAFFAISGYLITKSYYNSKDLKEFYFKRARRIYPAYIFTIFFGIFLASLSIDQKIYTFFLSGELLRYLFYNLLFLNFLQPNVLDAFNNANISAINGALWTLKIEVQFYLILPIILHLIKRYGYNLVLISLFSLGISYKLILSELDLPIMKIFARQLPGQLPYFVVGIYLAINSRAKKLKISLSLILLSLLLTFQQQLNQLSPSLVEFAKMIIYPLSIITIGKSLLLKWERLDKFGDISYGIYIFHFPLIQFMTHHNLFNKPWLSFTLLCSALVLLAKFSWTRIESPFLKR